MIGPTTKALALIGYLAVMCTAPEPDVDFDAINARKAAATRSRSATGRRPASHTISVQFQNYLIDIDCAIGFPAGQSVEPRKALAECQQQLRSKNKLPQLSLGPTSTLVQTRQSQATDRLADSSNRSYEYSTLDSLTFTSTGGIFVIDLELHDFRKTFGPFLSEDYRTMTVQQAIQSVLSNVKPLDGKKICAENRIDVLQPSDKKYVAMPANQWAGRPIGDVFSANSNYVLSVTDPKLVEVLLYLKPNGMTTGAVNARGRYGLRRVTDILDHCLAESADRIQNQGGTIFRAHYHGRNDGHCDTNWFCQWQGLRDGDGNSHTVQSNVSWIEFHGGLAHLTANPSSPKANPTNPKANPTSPKANPKPAANPKNRRKPSIH